MATVLPKPCVHLFNPNPQPWLIYCVIIYPNLQPWLIYRVIIYPKLQPWLIYHVIIYPNLQPWLSALAWTLRKMYAAMVLYLDDTVGELVGVLQDRKMWEAAIMYILIVTLTTTLIVSLRLILPLIILPLIVSLRLILPLINTPLIVSLRLILPLINTRNRNLNGEPAEIECS